MPKQKLRTPAALPLKRAKLPHALRQANTPHRACRLALKALVDMVTSEELKPSDRLSAIKTILDYAGKQAPPEDTDAELRVVFDGLEEGFAD